MPFFVSGKAVIALPPKKQTNKKPKTNRCVKICNNTSDQNNKNIKTLWKRNNWTYPLYRKCLKFVVILVKTDI